jgi:predicted dehydrogenase
MLKIGVAGLGFAGMLHAKAAAACAWQAHGPDIRLAAVADPRGEVTAGLARRHPDLRSFEDGIALARDAEVDAVVVAVPNAQHAAVACAALEAGKPVLIEKPLAAQWDDARAIANAAARGGVPVSAGYVFLNSPAVAWAIQTVRAGDLGVPLHIALTHAEDYAAVQGPAHGEWRADPAQAGFGALGDLGAHALSLGLALCGPVRRVSALMGRVPGRTSATDDHASALIAFAGGAQGTVTASRVARGRKMHLGFELHATGGSLLFDHERPNEIRVCRSGDDGFATHLIGPGHPHYAGFLPAAGHGLGFADLFTIQMRLWAESLLGGAPFAADLGFAMSVEALLHDLARAAGSGGWVDTDQRGSAA